MIIAWRNLFCASYGLVLFLTGCSESGQESIFDDVTLTSGLDDYQGMTHGVAWGDFDNDGLPDVYVTNHLNQAVLYRNTGNGRFENVTLKTFSAEQTGGDKHGALWADFDNNGTLDLVQLTGAVMGTGAEPKKLFVNNGNSLLDQAESLGVDNPFGRTRMPLWVDLNNDGFLDLLHGAEARFDKKTPPFVFVQQNGRFIEAPEALPIASRSAPFCIVTELTGDHFPELVCRVVGKNKTVQIFDLSTYPAKELDLLPVTAFEDIAAADFNNDGQIDIFMTRKNPSGPIAFGHPGTNELNVDITIPAAAFNKAAGFDFWSTGHLDFQIASQYSTEKIAPELVFLGAEGFHPDRLSFPLSDETAGINKLAEFTPGQQAGVFIGKENTGQWLVRASGAPKTSSGEDFKKLQVALNVKSSEPISQVNATGFTVTEERAPARLFMNRNGKFIEEGDKRGVNEFLVAGVNVVAGDFDNDMNIDLFVLGSGDVGKQANVLLMNRGNGYFDIIPNAGGAGGSRIGVGDSVTAVDFDQDGFLDLFIANGGSMGRSLGFPSEKGDYTLYRNKGNGNHWLEIDLEGSKSNRDGIGAVVRVTAGGVTQMRVQDGGAHHRSQNHSQLHFGLAQNKSVDKLIVQWPSGVEQEINNVVVDRVMRIKEPN